MAIKEDDLADERYVCPKEAEKKFKLAQGMRQTVYLYGITGSGKTAFVKNMLKRKHYSYYTARETCAEKLNISDNGKFYIIVVADSHLTMPNTSMAYVNPCREYVFRYPGEGCAA